MKFSGQLHANDHFAPGGRAPVTPWIGSWVGPRAGLDALAEWKRYPLPAGNWSLVTILTELHWLPSLTIAYSVYGWTFFVETEFAGFPQLLACFQPHSAGTMFETHPGNLSRPALGPPSLLSNGYQGLFLWGVKGPGREADHSPPSSVESENAWRYT
jgi:hypothetical protein